MELTEIRKKIDRIDLQLVKLLGERLELAVRTKKHKALAIDPEREARVIANIKEYGSGLLRADYLEMLFQRIIAESHALENEELKLIGFQGDHGSYSEMAALQAFSDHAPMPVAGFREVFEKVEAGDFDLGIVPVENSTEGMITEVHDLLVEKNLFIAAEHEFPIHHQLLTLASTSIRDIHTVCSHPQALAQCRRFIERRKLEARPFFDTAGAARWLAENRIDGTAVIAGSLCAGLYGLESLLTNIEDEPNNMTRFLVLSRNENQNPMNQKKTSLIFSTHHHAGALYQNLRLFAEASLNLTRIESRPVKADPGQYLFFVDLIGSADDPIVTSALDKIREISTFYKFLGSYGKA